MRCVLSCRKTNARASAGDRPRPDAAIGCLERAFERRSGAIYGIKGSFLFKNLRGHPRFESLSHQSACDGDPGFHPIEPKSGPLAGRGYSWLADIHRLPTANSLPVIRRIAKGDKLYISPSLAALGRCAGACAKTASGSRHSTRGTNAYLLLTGSLALPQSFRSLR